jgi:hypothetical protein
VRRVLPIALALLLCGPALTMLPEEVTLSADQYGRALTSAYERGHWDGWKKHAEAFGGGL